MVSVYVSVMDYCAAAIKMYRLILPKNWQVEDVEEWLRVNTDYKDSQCFFMTSEKEIEVIYKQVTRRKQ